MRACLDQTPCLTRSSRSPGPARRSSRSITPALVTRRSRSAAAAQRCSNHTEHRGRVWADVLESLRESRQAAYVEIERRDVSSNETRTEVSASVLRSVRVTESRSLAALCGDIERRHLEAVQEFTDPSKPLLPTV